MSGPLPLQLDGGRERSPKPCRCGSWPTRSEVGGGWTCSGCLGWYPAESEHVGGRGLRCSRCDKLARNLHGDRGLCWACSVADMRRARLGRDAAESRRLDLEARTITATVKCSAQHLMRSDDTGQGLLFG